MKAPVDKRKILFVEQNSDGTVGGSHFCLLELIEHLDRQHFEPLVLFYEHHSLIPQFERLSEVLVVSPIQPIKLESPHSIILNGRSSLFVGFFQKTINWTRRLPYSAFQWSRIIQKHKISLLHLNNSIHIGTDWLMAAKLTGTKCITHQRGFGPPIKKFSARYFDRIICITNQICSYITHYNPILQSNAVVVHDGLDAQKFINSVHKTPQMIRHEFGIDDHEHLIGIVGNIKEWKGQDVVIRGLALLNDRYKFPVRCMIIGDVSNEEEDKTYLRKINRLIRDSGLEKQIIFTGFRNDVPDIVNALDILVHASIQPEPMGRVILEGMALRKPVIATNHGGPQEIIEHGRSGILVPPDDPESLASSIIQLLESPGLRHRIGESAAERVNQAFDVSKNVEIINNLYLALLPELMSKKASRDVSRVKMHRRIP